MDYFLLEQDLRIPDITAVSEVPDHMDPFDWILGKKVAAPTQPLRLQLARSGGNYRGAIISGLVTVFSDSLKKLLTTLGIDNIDYFPVELEHPETKSVESGYSLVNILGNVECVDADRTTIVPRASGGRGRLKSFHVDPVATKGFRLFRLHEAPKLIIIDQDVKQSIRDADDVRGCSMRPTWKYDGF